MTTNGAWVDGTFYDGIDLTAADLNANNQWLLAQVPTVGQPNVFTVLQTFGKGLRITPTTVAGLPASPVDGQEGFVTDAAALTFGSAVTGGGSLHGPVYYDGSSTSWKAG